MDIFPSLQLRLWLKLRFVESRKTSQQKPSALAVSRHLRLWIAPLSLQISRRRWERTVSFLSLFLCLWGCLALSLGMQRLDGEDKSKWSEKASCSLFFWVRKEKMSISLHELLAKKTGRTSLPSTEEPLPNNNNIVAPHEPIEAPVLESPTFIDESHLEDDIENEDMLLGAETNFQYHREDEQEMPGSSTTITDDEDILQLLGNSQSQQSSRLSTGKLDKDHDIVELFSTIAFLKKENQDLQKDLELTKRSKDATMKDLQTKLDSQINILQKRNLELQETLSNREREQSETDILRSEIDRLKSDLEQLASEKETLENNVSKSKDDHGSLRGDLLAAKSEVNRLKMELGRAKGDNERLDQENNDLKNDFKTVKTEMDQNSAFKDEQLRQLQQEIKRLEEQLQHSKNEIIEKSQLIAKMTEDILAFDRNLQLTTAQNNDLKQRVAIMDIMERDIQGLRQRTTFLEKENRDLLTEVGTLRNQLQLSSSSSISSLRPTPPPPPPPLSSIASSSGYTPYNIPSVAPVSSSATYPHATSASSIAPHLHPPPSTSSHRPYEPAHQHTYSQFQSHQQPPSQQPFHYSDYNNATNSNNASAPPSHRSVKSLSSALGDNVASDVRQPTNLARPRDSIGSVLGTGINISSNMNNNSNSLASLLQSKKQTPASMAAATGRRLPGDSPFATEQTAMEIMSSFDAMERELTQFMTEKTMLVDESEKLHQRGLKTLRERTRLQQIEARLDEVGKSISSLRQKLSQKPG